MAKDWQQHQVFDGTYDLDDLLDWHEITIVKNENRLRADAVPREGDG
jgi:hypothetical protein